MFSLMVITGDDIEFSTAVTGSLEKDPAAAITDSYRRAADGKFGRPAVVLTFAPFMPQYSGDDYVNILSKASYGAPCFGTIATDGTTDFSISHTILNGEVFTDKIVLGLIYGNFKPKFYVANISEEKIWEKSATVTKSSGNLIIEIDNKPVTAYFEEIGLLNAMKAKHAPTFISLPFLFDYQDGTPLVSKIFVTLTPENYALCAGAVPEGSTLYIATNERTDILNTTGRMMDKILSEAQSANGLLIYSCLSRSLSMNNDPLAEAALVNFKLNNNLPISIAYSGGEICPTVTSSEMAINRFHNNTFVACLF
jgi:hypothetical protein